MNIQWFPGHMQKTRRQLAEKLKIVDMVIAVCDARAPRSTLNPDFDDLFKGKSRLVVLNKSDLADPAATSAWLKFFADSGASAVAFSAVSDKPEKLLSKINEAAAETVEKYRQKGVNKTIRAMVAGIPNVGKSAVLNRLAGQKKAKEGNRPGVTRGLQWVKLSPYLELMDTPGVLMPKIADPAVAVRIAALGSIREEVLNIEELALSFIPVLNAAAPEAIKTRYGVETAGEDALEILYGLCKKRGFLVMKGEYDLERGARTLLDEFQAGKLGRITLERP